AGPVSARRVAGDQRSRHHDRHAAADGARRKRHQRPGRGGVAHHRVAVRPRPGEHDPARRLAPSRARAPHRAGAVDLPAGALLRRIRRAGRRSRRAARARRQPDQLSAALCDDRGAGAGHRSGHARYEQSALGDLSARPHRGSSRGATAAKFHRPPVAGAADRRVDRDPAAHRRRRQDRRCLDHGHRALADEAVGCDQRGLPDQQRAIRFHLGGAGVIYDVRQITTCAYASPVAHARHVLRLTPVSRDGERVHVASLQIVPEPVRRRESKDFFGNISTWIEIAEPHDTLTVKLQARVAVDAPVEPLATPVWETVREEAFATSDIGPLSPAHFLFPSRMVSLDPEIRDYIRQSFAPGRPVFDAAIELIGRMKCDIAYEIGATTVTTPPPMSFALRRGVCQDFAHIMISGLRGIGLPAAYVSGYLRTVPKGQAERLEGGDAMHAWVMVWCGAEAGWYGLDPTNAIYAGDDHVVLAIGRDYSDIAPIEGV